MIKTLYVRYTEDKKMIRCTYEGQVLSDIYGEDKEKMLKEVVQTLQNQYHFDRVDVDVNMDIYLLHGLEMVGAREDD